MSVPYIMMVIYLFIILKRSVIFLCFSVTKFWKFGFSVVTKKKEYMVFSIAGFFYKIAKYIATALACVAVTRGSTTKCSLFSSSS